MVVYEHQKVLFGVKKHFIKFRAVLKEDLSMDSNLTRLYNPNLRQRLL